MVALRLFSLLLAVGFALPAYALTFPYEAVGQGGQNNIYDSNAESCDNSTFNGTVWTSGGQGCYDRTGALCSANPAGMCDLQIVPKGRCTYGDPSATGGPGSTNTCLWPHGAGRCTGNTRVGCVTDAHLNDANNVASGAAQMCAGTGNTNCDMTTDPYGGPFRTACRCQGDSSALPNYEQTVCGTAGGTLESVCSDGDPERDVGGYGTALGVELNQAPPTGNSFANMGPSIRGDSTATTSPPYANENIPGNASIEPQRAAGSVGRPVTDPNAPITPIHPARTTDARDIDPNFNAALEISKITVFGDSYWNDWAYVSKAVAGTFNTHIVVFSCDPPVGFVTSQPVPGTGGQYCSAIGRKGVAFMWNRNLTPAEQALPTCPPACKKDFDITTYEIEAFAAAGALDPDAGAQLAIQSGEGPSVGAGDVVGVAVVTSNTWLNFQDMRCRMGGWGSPANEIGRCADGPNSCDPSLANPNPNCAGQGNNCNACNGPITVANPDGFPIGYNTHGLPELDLKVGQRIGGIAGPASLVRVPLFVVGTTGLAASDFRDLPGTGTAPLDLADMGLVDTLQGTPSVGVGAGGTFGTGVLPIGENCCTTVPNGPAGGTPIVWQPFNGGFPDTDFNRPFDRGPGTDGIPGCSNDTSAISNGLDACDQRLGKGPVGSKTSGFDAPGKDDQPSLFNVGTSGLIPASDNRFGLRNATTEVVNHFSGPPYNYASPNPKTWNSIASFTFRDISVFGTANTDILVKVNSTFCPLVGNVAKCTSAACPSDPDADGVCNVAGFGQVDNCPTVANGPAQAGTANVGNQTDTDADGAGDGCDNCRTFSNPRVAAGFLGSNQWATLTGDQRDDDHDGYGNKCDGKFPGISGLFVGGGDLTEWRAGNTKNRAQDICGTGGTRPCAIFDLDETGTFIGGGDLTQWRLLNTKSAGPRCPTCPLACTAGTAGTCGPIP